MIYLRHLLGNSVVRGAFDDDQFGHNSCGHEPALTALSTNAPTEKSVCAVSCFAFHFIFGVIFIPVPLLQPHPAMDSCMAAGSRCFRLSWKLILCSLSSVRRRKRAFCGETLRRTNVVQDSLSDAPWNNEFRPGVPQTRKIARFLNCVNTSIPKDHRFTTYLGKICMM